jgi:hypothetical protein
MVADKDERLRRLSDERFDPRAVAFVEEPVELPATCDGSVIITGDTPQHVTIAADMQTPGLVVLADRWDAGWKAYLDGNQVPILITNHAVRGVAVPAEKHVLEFRFQPASFARGAVLSGLALLTWIVWIVAVAVAKWRSLEAPRLISLVVGRRATWPARAL